MKVQANIFTVETKSLVGYIVFKLDIKFFLISMLSRLSNVATYVTTLKYNKKHPTQQTTLNATYDIGNYIFLHVSLLLFMGFDY